MDRTQSRSVPQAIPVEVAAIMKSQEDLAGRTGCVEPPHPTLNEVASLAGMPDFATIGDDGITTREEAQYGLATNFRSTKFALEIAENCSQPNKKPRVLRGFQVAAVGVEPTTRGL